MPISAICRVLDCEVGDLFVVDRNLLEGASKDGGTVAFHHPHGAYDCFVDAVINWAA